MAKLNTLQGYTFDATQVELKEYEPLPIGTYEFMISETEVTTSKAGSEMLVFTFECQHDEYQGRQIKEYLVVGHEKPSVANMAIEKLARISLAVNLPQFDDTDEFVGLTCLLKLGIEKATEYTDPTTGEKKMGYDSNSIKAFINKKDQATSIQSSAPAQAAAAPAASQTQAAATPQAGQELPWMKK